MSAHADNDHSEECKTSLARFRNDLNLRNRYTSLSAVWKNGAEMIVLNCLCGGSISRKVGQDDHKLVGSFGQHEGTIKHRTLLGLLASNEPGPPASLFTTPAQSRPNTQQGSAPQDRTDQTQTPMTAEVRPKKRRVSDVSGNAESRAKQDDQPSRKRKQQEQHVQATVIQQNNEGEAPLHLLASTSLGLGLHLAQQEEQGQGSGAGTEQGSNEIQPSVLHKLENALRQLAILQAVMNSEIARPQGSDKAEIDALQQRILTLDEQLVTSKRHTDSAQSALCQQKDSHQSQVTALQQALDARDARIAILQEESHAQLSHTQVGEQQTQIMTLLENSSARDAQVAATTFGFTQALDKQLAAFEVMLLASGERFAALAKAGVATTHANISDIAPIPPAHWDSTDVSLLQNQLYCMDGSAKELRQKLRDFIGIANTAVDVAFTRITNMDTVRNVALDRAIDAMQQISRALEQKSQPMVQELSDVRKQLQDRDDELQQTRDTLTNMRQEVLAITAENIKLKRRHTEATVASRIKVAQDTGAQAALHSDVQAGLLTQLGVYQQLAALAVAALQDKLGFQMFADNFIQSLPNVLAPQILKDGLGSMGAKDMSDEMQLELNAQIAALARTTPGAMLHLGLESAPCWLIKYILKFSKRIDRDVIRLLAQK